MAAVVSIRYGFNNNSIALQESVTYLHGLLFMLAAAYTLRHDEHVRVDIFYRRFSPHRKAWINCLGTLVFLLPVCGFIFFSSLHFVSESWRVREASPLPGGLPGVFLLKSLIPLMALTLFIQGLAELLRNLLFLITEEPDAT
jgi:TRAP-type mannitol/chloroaromatic compound transport system permease small subunit